MFTYMLEFELLEGHQYKGNVKLRRAGVPLDFTAEQALEYIKCMESFEYFCTNYLKIVTLDHGLQPFIPRPYQMRLAEAAIHNRFILGKLSRQSGKTAIVAAILLWYALFNEDYTIAVLAHKQEQAIEILDRIKGYYENMPFWLQQGVIEWNKKSITIENRSKIFAAATTATAIAGRSISIAYADEFDLIDLNMQEAFYVAAFPTISSGQTTKFIITTTPRGLKFFYKLWTDSEQGNNDYVRVTIDYWEVPGRTAEWREKEIKRMGSELMFRREYECAFLGSSNTLVDGKKLGTLPHLQTVMQDPNGHLHIFYQPESNKQYTITVDVSEGVGGDYSTFSVIDVSTIPYQVVATYANDMITPLFYPNIIFDIAQYYNNAYVIIESNTIGAEVANILYYELEYENVLSTNVKSKRGEIDETPRSYLGIKQTKKTKHLGCANLKALIENDQLMVNDFRILYELSRFVRKGSSFRAEDNEHDDLVMSLILFAYLTTTNSFKEITGTDTRNFTNLQNLNAQQEHIPLGMFISTQQDQLVNDFVMGEFDRWMLE